MPKWKARKKITKGKIMSNLKKNTITNMSKRRERKANMMGRKASKRIKGLIQKLFIQKLYKEKDLIIQFIKRDMATKHKGSWLGITWTAINPIIMLMVYTLIFSQVFNARWGSSTANNDPIYFGLNLFCGLIVFNVPLR